MQIGTGKVIAGKVVVEGINLHEGELVTVLTREVEGAVTLSAEDEREIQAAIGEADRGETLSPEELFARLGRIN
jgi:hypothetical protein